MARLTRRYEGIAETSEKLRYCSHAGITRRLLERLADYEDAEEQGLLLRLPCKPWDKLYWISDQDDDEYGYEPIEEVEISRIDYNGYSIQLWFSDKGEKEFPVLPSNAIESELFFTKEEAEAALEKMNGEEHE